LEETNAISDNSKTPMVAQQANITNNSTKQP
jgi:hypothetical protein